MDDIIKNVVDIDVDLLEKKALYTYNGLNSRFYTLYKNYKILLEKYLLKKIPLKEYDDSMRDSGLLIIPVQKEDMCYYQLLSTFDLKYIYLRSDLHVDKLSFEDIELLVNLTVDELSNPSDKTFELIDRTYKNVIDSKKNADDVIVMNCYGPDREEFWFPSNELIFVIRYDEFADNGLGEEDEWDENYNKQLMFIGEMMNSLNKICSDILGIKVNFIYFDDNTIKKTELD